MFLHRAPIWGLLRNRIYDGILGMFQKNQIDVSISPLRFTTDRINILDFTSITWVTTPTIVFRHPQSGLKNIFQQPFTANVWWLILLLAFVVSVIVTVAMNHQPNSVINMTVIRAFIITMGIICQQGIVENYKKFSVRATFYVFVLFSAIIYQFYSSFIVSSLLTDPPKTINTLRQLIDSKLDVGIENITYNLDFFETTNDLIAQELFRKKIEGHHGFHNVGQGLKLVKKGGFAFHVDTSYAYKLIQEIFSDQEICELHEMLLFPIRPLAVAVAKDSSFNEFFKIGIQRLFESGLIDRQTKKWSAIKPKCLKSVTKVKAVDINQAFPILILLAISTILSFLTLFGEILHFRCYYSRQMNE